MPCGHRQPSGELFFAGSAISSVNEKEDLGVVITADLKSSAKCIAVEQNAQKILDYIRRVVCYQNKQTVLHQYSALVNLLLEYSAKLWFPIRRVYVEHLEKVQARAIKLLDPWFTTWLISESSHSSTGGFGAWLLRLLRFLEVSVCWTEPLCLNCPLIGFRTTVISWCLLSSTLCSRGINLPTLWNSHPKAVVNSPSIDPYKRSLNKMDHPLMYGCVWRPLQYLGTWS